MTITVSPLILPTVERYQTFSTTISLAVDVGIITSVVFDKNFVDSEIAISNSTSSLTISGKHTTAFNGDEVIYVEKGSSDKLQTPSVVTNFSSVPLNKDVIEVNQDPSESKTRTYTAIINHTGGSNTFTLTQTIDNDVTSAKNFLEDYY